MIRSISYFQRQVLIPGCQANVQFVCGSDKTDLDPENPKREMRHHLLTRSIYL